MGFTVSDALQNRMRKKGKEEVLIQRAICEHMRQQDLLFFLDIPKMLEFSLFLEIGEMRRKEGKEEILRLRGIGEHMRQQDLPFFSDI